MTDYSRENKNYRSLTKLEKKRLTPEQAKELHKFNERFRRSSQKFNDRYFVIPTNIYREIIHLYNEGKSKKQIKECLGTTIDEINRAIKYFKNTDFEEWEAGYNLEREASYRRVITFLGNCSLTPVQKTIVFMLAEGNSQSKIAERTGLSPQSVNNKIKSLRNNNTLGEFLRKAHNDDLSGTYGPLNTQPENDLTNIYE